MKSLKRLIKKNDKVLPVTPITPSNPSHNNDSNNNFQYYLNNAFQNNPSNGSKLVQKPTFREDCFEKSNGSPDYIYKPY